MAPSGPTAARRAWLAGWLLLCFGAAAAGALTPPDAWFAGLVKPSWQPPDAVFGPVWTLLYTLMAVAAWRVHRRAGWAAARGALGLFLLQLALNAAWTPLFFGLHRIDLALIDILALDLALVATIVAFRRHDRVAAFLLLPYLAWILFATTLTAALWRLNT